MKVTYQKLRNGDWGIRVEGGAVQPGQRVTVTKRDGVTKAEVVGKILFSDKGVTLATVDGSGARPAGGRTGGGNSCAACGRGGRLVEDMEDGLMKHYNCCDMPPDGY